MKKSAAAPTTRRPETAAMDAWRCVFLESAIVVMVVPMVVVVVVAVAVVTLYRSFTRVDLKRRNLDQEQWTER